MKYLSFLLFCALTSYYSSAQYCTPPQPIDGPWTGISNVSLGSINNTTANDDGYTDYTATTTAPTLSVGASYTITLNLEHTITGSIFSDSLEVRVWIDYNGNQDFTDAGEDVVNTQVDLSTGGLSAPFNFTVPGTATAGTTRMRVYEDMLVGDGHEPPTPCGYSTGLGQHGEIEDYNVTISATSGAAELVDLPVFEIYPNPITDFATVRFNGSLDATEIGLYDLVGRKVITYSNRALNGLQISSEGLHPGIYFLRACGYNDEQSRKVIIR